MTLCFSHITSRSLRGEAGIRARRRICLGTASPALLLRLAPAHAAKPPHRRCAEEAITVRRAGRGRA
ncbi:hypothetical protein STXM2123_4120 [Streptomyces sp. F-3]|nr:hypothetical protein STXM2123_4120 [Streptomyces sp. F-3]